MKIAFMHYWTLQMRRGIETMVLSLANELAEQGADVSVLAARQTQEPLIKLSSKVRLKQFPSPRYFSSAAIVPFYLADLLRNKYDIVILFFADFGEGWALKLASPFIKSNLFLYLTFPYEAAPHRYKSYRRLDWGHKARLILADADYTAQEGKAFFNRNVELLPSGTDPERFKPDQQNREAIRRQYGFHPDNIVLLNVSALEKRKGVYRVIEAMPAILAHNPQVRYLILGAGPEREHLQSRVRNLGIENEVIFAGTTTDLPPYYNAADIFVMLSDAEAGSIACLEAMSSGLPTIVSNTCGFNEVVSHATGRTIDPNDTNNITSTILELSQNCPLRQKLGVAGREVIIQRFSWAQIASQLYSLCEETTDDRR